MHMCNASDLKLVIGIRNFIIYSNIQDGCSAMQTNVVNNIHLVNQVYCEMNSSCMICFANQAIPVFIVLIICCIFRCMHVKGILLYTEAVPIVKSLLHVNTN